MHVKTILGCNNEATFLRRLTSGNLISSSDLSSLSRPELQPLNKISFPTKSLIIITNRYALTVCHSK